MPLRAHPTCLALSFYQLLTAQPALAMATAKWGTNEPPAQFSHHLSLPQSSSTPQHLPCGTAPEKGSKSVFQISLRTLGKLTI